MEIVILLFVVYIVIRIISILAESDDGKKTAWYKKESVTVSLIVLFVVALIAFIVIMVIAGVEGWSQC